MGIRSRAALAGLVVATVAWCAPLAALANCGSAVCLVNTNWDVQGVWTETGLRFELRYEQVKQDELRAGTKKVGPDAVTDEFVPLQTTDRNFVASLDWQIDQRWGVAAALPVVRRTHDQLVRDPAGDFQETLAFDRSGDMRVVGRFQFYADADIDRGMYTAGANLGLKLPTGADDLTFPSGERAEPALQPGTGSTDLVLGGYFRATRPGGLFAWFAQAFWQPALVWRDGFKPGDKVRADLGLRYQLNRRIALLAQVNTLWADHDSGVRVEPENTGGTLVAFSPGVSVALTRKLQIYGFYQQPIYQYLNGVQLATRYSFALGVAARF
jgi:hypothetical protein